MNKALPAYTIKNSLTYFLLSSIWGYVTILLAWLFQASVGEWCNGSTAAFGAVDPGSSPGSLACFLSEL